MSINYFDSQHRSQLFEELIYELLKKSFSKSIIDKNAFVPKQWKRGGVKSYMVDFVVRLPENKQIIVETKAPYTVTPFYGINRSMKRLKLTVDVFKKQGNLQKIIFALASKLPHESAQELEKTKNYIHKNNVEFELWDIDKIKELIRKYFNANPELFDITNLERLKKSCMTTLPQKAVDAEEKLQLKIKEELIIKKIVKDDKYDNVIILCADFCSFSKFVKASKGKEALVVAMMKRFYQETRKIIDSSGAILDKFMGDGILFYWVIKKLNKKFEKIIDSCNEQLLSVSLKIAKEWQDELDDCIDIMGMRIGGALGDIYLIRENSDKIHRLHIIGDCINLASRLSSTAKPENFLISHQLKKKIYPEDNNFKKISPLEIKNMGKIISWQKTISKKNEK